MGGLFKTPKAPEIKELPPTPTVDQVMVDRNTSDMLRRRKGRAATDLTSGGGAGTSGSVASKQLLGS